MSNSERLIQILPHGRQIKATTGMSLLEALMQQSIFLRSDCGGKGKCGKCRVHKETDLGSYEPIESCLYTINADISIKIPESSMQPSYIMSKAPVKFPAAFKNQFSNVKIPDSYGIAVDLGTTTIAVYLCNMPQGKVVSSLAVKNPQAVYGDDIMSRIGVIGQRQKNLGKLQNLVVKSIEWGITELLSAFGNGKNSISRMMVVGNPTMIHILAGVDPQSIGISPYEPAFYDAKHFHSKQLGFGINGVSIQTLPQVSGFIGGDILAAALAVEFEKQPDGTLLIDLGTNGELLLKNKEQHFATSCATGPAFEGASLSCGMQAIPGAIKSIEIDTDQNIVRYSIINPQQSSITKPSGICGAGVINSVAQFCEKQIIAPGGAFRSGESGYILVPENKDYGQPGVYISQKDIRSVQLGKSALISGIEFLLKEAGLDKPQKIIIAGAFGSHLNKLDLIRLGMIPKIDLEKIEMAGNSAGTGAIMTLCNAQYLDRAEQMAKKIETVDLACNVDFQEVFIRNLNFPDEVGN
jgi:uncharacterized 2Fe-2S/4Fe-4S cluster protein (DUF4445 family)